MSTEMLEELRRRVIKNFMDVLILTELKKEEPLSGYDVISYIHKRFGILVSSGTVYSLLYSMEREGLVKAVQNRRKRVYALTEKGEQNIKVVTKANAEIQNLLRNMLVLKE